MFVKGQRIVCINDDFEPAAAKYYRNLPKKGVTYTVRAVFLARGKVASEKPGDSDGEIGILLIELMNDADPICKTKLEPGFNQERFAPLEEVPGEEETEVCAVSLSY